MSTATSATSAKTAILGCGNAQCHRFKAFAFDTHTEKLDVLALNAQEPWACDSHTREET